MRDHAAIQQELEAAISGPSSADRGPRLKELRKELSDSIASGAQPCPKCGGEVMGMLKKPETATTKPIYEIGCRVCFNPTPHAQGNTIEQVLQRWNAGEIGGLGA